MTSPKASARRRPRGRPATASPDLPQRQLTAVRPGSKSEILARLRQHQDAAAAGAPARRPRPAGLPACEKQCAKGCALCMKKVSGAVLECLRILFNGWIVERIRRAYAAPRRGERVLLKLLEDRVV